MTSNTEAGSESDPTNTAGSGNPAGAGNAAGPKNRAKPVLIGVSVLAVVALAASVWFGIGWLDARADQKTADTRDSALSGAQQAVINMTTLDSQNLDQSFDTILTSVTGDDMNKFIEDQRDLTAKTTSDLLTGTLTQLSEDEGTAEALVVVATTTTRDGYQPSRQRLVMKLNMEDVDGTWKASQATPIGTPVPLNPAEGTVDPNATPTDPNATPVDPGAGAADPNAVPADPDAGSVDPSAPLAPEAPSGP